ncbi:hypothetical protein Hanom_Chr17g01545031 [Helianthus anomalus]
MSWLSIYIFGEYSEESVVPDSYEGAAIFASYDIPIPSNTREEEVVSGFRYRDNTVELDLNVPVEDFDTQHGYSNYGYGGEPYPQAEYPYSQPNYPDHGYGGEQSYVQQEYPDHGYGGERSFVQQDYPNHGYRGEHSYIQQDYPDLGEGNE